MVNVAQVYRLVFDIWIFEFESTYVAVMNYSSIACFIRLAHTSLGNPLIPLDIAGIEIAEKLFPMNAWDSLWL